MGKSSLLTFTLGSLLGAIGCSFASNNAANVDVSLVGKWENTSSSFFGSGWDQCEFKEDKSFECTNFPNEGGLVLPYDGDWSFINNKLTIIYSEIDEPLIFSVSDMSADSLVVETRKGEVLKEL
ncbi:hypothetical protein [Microbulbifer epialgicus]|uniref:Lipocalin-like domain-containing protein n=1 Tax=Microbulbifer epialgicus TaxID=393907 RepID=A0ABV4P7U1_9GAMM